MTDFDATIVQLRRRVADLEALVADLRDVVTNHAQVLKEHDDRFSLKAQNDAKKEAEAPPTDPPELRDRSRVSSSLTGVG